MNPEPQPGCCAGRALPVQSKRTNPDSVLTPRSIHSLGLVGHIEDIAVDKSQQGKKLGLRIIQALTAISENSGCYKTILNCSDSNIRK